jgi:hypothetical protein
VNEAREQRHTIKRRRKTTHRSAQGVLPRGERLCRVDEHVRAPAVGRLAARVEQRHSDAPAYTATPLFLFFFFFHVVDVLILVPQVPVVAPLGLAVPRRHVLKLVSHPIVCSPRTLPPLLPVGLLRILLLLLLLSMVPQRICGRVVCEEQGGEVDHGGADKVACLDLPYLVHVVHAQLELVRVRSGGGGNHGRKRG